MPISTQAIIIVVIAIIALFACYRRKKIQRLIDHAISRSVTSQLLLLAATTVLVFGLLLLMIWLIDSDKYLRTPDWLYAFINPGSTYGNPSEKDSEKFLRIIFGFFGMILLSGLLISVFSNILERRVEKVKNGQLSYSFNDHFVIIGFDEMTASIIKQIYNDNDGKEIVVQTAKNIVDVRRRLEVDLDRKEMNRVVFIHGASNSEEDIQKLCVRNACRIIVLGDDGNDAHDAVNMECVRQITALLPDAQRKRQIECDVLFNNQSTYAILQKIGIDRNWQNKIHFRPFNFHETWAQKVIVCNQTETGKIAYPSLDRKEGIQYDSDSTVHFVIMGMNSMGIALALNAARTLHFPNFLRDSRLKTHVTLIDPNAAQEMNFFISRYPHLFELVDFDYTDAAQNTLVPQPISQYKNPDLEFNDFLDIRFSFVNGSFESPGVRRLISDWAQDDSTILTIAVCHDDTVKSIAAGLYLPPAVFAKGKEIPVFIQQKETSCLFTENMGKHDKYRNIRPFGMVNECYSMKDIKEVEARAMRVGWVYDRYCEYRNSNCQGLNQAIALQKVKEDKINAEDFEKKWKSPDTKILNRWADIYNALAISVKERSFDLSGREVSKDDVCLLAEVEHNRWNIERLLFGFRATTKEQNEKIYDDVTKKDIFKADLAHVDIRPYNELIKDDKNIMANEYDICLSECLLKIIDD